MPKHLKRRRCAGEAVLSAYYDGARGELSRRENFIISIESLRYLISSLGKESLVKTSSASEKKLKLADGKGIKNIPMDFLYAHGQICVFPDTPCSLSQRSDSG